jgi:Suppressor of fused protein (SUFU)
MTTSRPDYLRSIREHYQRQWGACDELRWPRGPIEQLPEGFSVLKFQPSARNSLFTFATCGMSATDDAGRVECFILSPVADKSICELLTIVAWYHRNCVRLGLGHTINFGRPWLPQSECDHGLFSTPHLHSAELEQLDNGGGATKFLWLIPITAFEREFMVNCGLEALEMRFEANALDYANPHRQSIVQFGETTGMVWQAAKTSIAPHPDLRQRA